MNIQGNVNRAISLAGLLFSQTPMAAAAKEKSIESEKIKSLEKNVEKAVATNTALEGAIGGTNADLGASEAVHHLKREALEREVKAREELFYKNPTAAGADDIIKQKTALRTNQDIIDKIAAERLNAEQKRIESSKIRAMILSGTPSETTKIWEGAKNKNREA